MAGTAPGGPWSPRPHAQGHRRKERSHPEMGRGKPTVPGGGGTPRFSRDAVPADARSPGTWHPARGEFSPPRAGVMPGARNACLLPHLAPRHQDVPPGRWPGLHRFRGRTVWARAAGRLAAAAGPFRERRGERRLRPAPRASQPGALGAAGALTSSARTLFSVAMVRGHKVLFGSRHAVGFLSRL